MADRSFHVGRLNPPLDAIPRNHAPMVQALRDIADRLERGEALMDRGQVDYVGHSVYTRGGLVSHHAGTGLTLTLTITTSR